ELVARVVLGERQRVAVAPVAGAKLALEVRGPQLVRGIRDWAQDPRMNRLPPRVPLVHQPTAREEVSDGARRRPARPSRMPTLEDGEELPRAPVRMRDPLGDQERLQGRGDLVR